MAENDSSGVIREFLVSLGYKEDEVARKKLATGLQNLTQGVLALGKGITLAAVAVTAGVTKFASNLEQLYFASLRVRTSASNIKVVELAFQNLGVSAEESLGALESLASFQRRNPAGAGFLASLGVTAKDGKQQLVQLAEYFRSIPEYLAFQYGDMLGMSEKTVMAMLNPQFNGEIDKAAKVVKDAKFDQAAKDAHDVMISVRDLTMQLQGMMNTLFDQRFKDFIRDLETFAHWARVLFDKFIALDRATNGWLSTLALLGGSIGILQSLGLIKGLTGIASGITSIGSAASGLLAPLAAAALALGSLYEAWKGFKTGSNDIWEDLSPKSQATYTDTVGKWVTQVRAFFGSKDDQDSLDSAARGEKRELLDRLQQESYKRRRAVKADSESNDESTSTTEGRQKYLIGYLERNNFSHEQALGIAAALHGESADYNPRDVGDNGAAKGIAQWHEDRRKKFEQFIGRPFDTTTFEDQVKFVAYELNQGDERSAGNKIRGASDPESAAYAATRSYLRPYAFDKDQQEAEARSRGGYASVLANASANSNTTGKAPAYMTGSAAASGATTNTQHNDIKISVDGAKDPHATATAVKRALDDTVSTAMHSFAYQGG